MIINFIEENITIISLILSVGTGVFALYQWTMTRKNEHARYVDELLKKMLDDKQIYDFLNIIDYGENWYNKNFHEDKNHIISTKADKTFFYLNYLCYLYYINVINKKDLEVFGYYLSTVGNNNDTKTYFLDLYQYSLTNNKKFPFEYFLNYCIRKSYCPKEIKNKNYYFQVLLIESAINNGHKLSISNVIKDIDVSFGKKLYIHTCFRCEYCKQYNTEEARCKKKHDYKDYKWCKVDDFCNDFLIKDLIVL